MGTDPVPAMAAGRRTMLGHGVGGVERSERVARIRAGYERFNEQDLDGLLELCTEDVEWPDVVNGKVLHGADEVRDYFSRIFTVATPLVTVGDVIEIGDAVIATIYQQFYDHEGRLLGDPRVVVNRYSFVDGLVSGMTLTSQDDIPTEVRRRFQAAGMPDIAD